MENPIGLWAVWQQGDWVTRSVMAVLLVMSVATWLVIILRLLVLAQVRAWARQVEAFWRGADFQQGLARLGPDPDNPFRTLAEAGHQAARHHREATGQLHGSLDMNEWITRCLRNGVDDAASRLQAGMALLASVGSTAPFVGLFGTVWGIYHALMGIGAAGQATIDKVAGPIGESLIMTALGLAVAIPAVLGYNMLVRGNKAVIARLNRFAYDLHAYLVTGARVGSHTNGPAPPG